MGRLRTSRTVKLHPVQYEAQHDKTFINADNVKCMHYKGYFIENCSTKKEAESRINSYNNQELLINL